MKAALFFRDIFLIIIQPYGNTVKPQQMTIKSKEQIEQMTSLSVEQKKELCTYLGRAQGRNKDYFIECDGDSADALLSWWHHHQQKAAARSAKRANRHTTAERQQQSLAEQCLQVISELADVRGKSVKDALATLKDQIDEVRRIETAKAEAEAAKATEKINAFKAEHADVISQYEALQSERSKLAMRSDKLNVQCVKAESKRKRTISNVEKFTLY